MFEDTITDQVRSKYTLLELDTFYYASTNATRTAYCLVEHTPIAEMFNMDRNLDLHTNMMRNYKLRNWKYCEDALEHLKGLWNGEADSFYNDIGTRIQSFKDLDPAHEWTPLINRSV